MWLLLLFIGVPLIEIALFIQVGGLIGLWPTLAVIVLTAILGSVLVRQQGLDTLERVRRALDAGTDPSRDLAHGVMILLAGLLMLTPGFFTDAVGFAFLVPAIRDRVFASVADRLVTQTVQMGGDAGRPGRAHPTVIDGEFEEVDPDTVPRRAGNRPSGWTRR